MRALFTLTLCMLCVPSLQAQEFKSSAAKAALDEYNKDLAAARQKYALALDEAAKQAVLADDVEDAIRIKAAKQALEEKPDTETKDIPRVLWKHKGGYFERLNDGFWVERVADGHAHIFAQGQTTDQYIEISRVTGSKTLVRMYDKHCDFLPIGKRGFTRLYSGKWEKRE